MPKCNAIKNKRKKHTTLSTFCCSQLLLLLSVSLHAIQLLLCFFFIVAYSMPLMLSITVKMEMEMSFKRAKKTISPKVADLHFLHNKKGAQINNLLSHLRL